MGDAVTMTTGDGSSQLTDPLIAQLAPVFSINEMKAIAQSYLNIDAATVKNIASNNAGDAVGFNRDVLSLWRNKNPEKSLQVRPDYFSLAYS